MADPAHPPIRLRETAAQKKIGECDFPIAPCLRMSILIDIEGRDRPDPPQVGDQRHEQVHSLGRHRRSHRL